MGKLEKNEISEFIAPEIELFHEKILQRLLGLELSDVLARKNPYLFRAKAIDTAQDLVKSILDAYLSAQEEGIFGGFLEALAIFINGKVYNGRKSSAEGVDLEFNRAGTHYIVSIKSGPHWGNSQQIKKMRDNFQKAKRILGTNTAKVKVVAVNGCCYGKERQADKGDYLKLCGQRFWEFISGEDTLYTDIVEPLGQRAKQKSESFKKEYAKVINRFTKEFATDYCDEEGAILWEKLVKFNSGKHE